MLQAFAIAAGIALIFAVVMGSAALVILAVCLLAGAGIGFAIGIKVGYEEGQKQQARVHQMTMAQLGAMRGLPMVDVTNAPARLAGRR